MSQQATPDAADAPPAPMRQRLGVRPLLIALALALVIAGSLLLVLRPAERVDARAIDPVSAPPTALAVAALPQPVAEDRSVAFEARLAGIDARQARLQAVLDDIETRLAGLDAQLAELSAADLALGVRLDALRRPPPKPVATRRSQPVAAAAPRRPALPTLVSIDLWDGRASAAIRGADGQVRFYGEGDTVGVARLVRIDGATRSVVLEHRNGKTSKLAVRGG